MKQYRRLLEQILLYGVHKEPARDNMPATTELFDETISIINGELPILNYKKVSFNNVLHELLWFLKGDTNIKYLIDNNCNIWNQDAYRYYKKLGGEHEFDEFIDGIKTNKLLDSELIKDFNRNYKLGDCGKIYGYQWRRYGDDNEHEVFISNDFKDSDTYTLWKDQVDQISDLIYNLKVNPNSRYHIVNAWNPQDIADGYLALPPCHMQFMCNVRTSSDGKTVLDLSMIQRSCDMFLGVPYNLLSYAILQRILCKFTGYEVGTFTWHGMSCHIYENQLDAVNEYLNRFTNDEFKFSKPKLEIDDTTWETIDNIKFEDFKLVDYNPLTAIKCKLSTGLK